MRPGRSTGWEAGGTSLLVRVGWMDSNAWSKGQGHPGEYRSEWEVMLCPIPIPKDHSEVPSFPQMPRQDTPNVSPKGFVTFGEEK